PWPAGGLSDIMARTLQPHLEEEFGQPIVVVNKVGGGAALGMSTLQRAKPDGHTIAMIHEPPLVANTLKGTAPYEVDKLRMLALLNYDAAALAVAADSQYDTFEEFLAAWKAGDVKVGVPGGRLTSDDSLAYFLLADAVGTDQEPVPFQGFGPLETAFAGGHVDAAVSNVGLFAKRPDLYKVLLVMDGDRSQYFPDVPTAQEKGYDVVFGAWRGLGTASAVPDEVLAKLRSAIEAVGKKPQVAADFDEIKAPLSYAPGEDFEAQLKNGADRQRALIEKLGSN
ncbi:MAG: tripartite tricarboxylate transporter substrate binding protein, partial [Pseudomonadota bacterium]